jgi:hypothetical protein
MDFFDFPANFQFQAPWISRRFQFKKDCMKFLCAVLYIICFAISRTTALLNLSGVKSDHKNTWVSSNKGSAKNKFAELALRFGLDLADPIEQSRRNSELFRGLCGRYKGQIT